MGAQLLAGGGGRAPPGPGPAPGAQPPARFAARRPGGRVKRRGARGPRGPLGPPPQASLGRGALGASGWEMRGERGSAARTGGLRCARSFGPPTAPTGGCNAQGCRRKLDDL